ncbi:MAG TPA: response regulator [Gemmataceae bacterium]|nr:response regulator [Gemmataceae bacterium]
MAGETILIVEDNTIQREGLAVVLRQQGFSVLLAADGRKALELADDAVPDLILLDMLIPDKDSDGWWFLKERRQVATLASVPVLITTALRIASDEWAASLGAAGLIRKPCDVEPLVATIRQCLSRA